MCVNSPPLVHCATVGLTPDCNLFLQYYRRPQDAHSFPTRRSSDLEGEPCRHRACQVHRQRVRTRRSEEHTSELQSHSDLVCRLLLEKKKQGRGHLPREQHICWIVSWRQTDWIRQVDVGRNSSAGRA